MERPQKRNFRVGLTGGIASGKTTVATLFAALGVPIIDADQISRELAAPGAALLGQIAERFGRALIRADGSLDRRALRNLVFADPTARGDLEALTHPAIFALIEERAASARGPYRILVLPLLVEKRDSARVDRVLVVDCDEALQIRRLQARDGATLDEARAILAAQVSRRARLAAADDVIVNEGDLGALSSQVERLHLAYLELAARAPT
ncbi:MAG TPA: dephospho-CoA kinase [Steroidobacteraceae bacterium]|nr:dephospho-CoA kinase [Steroidobacteraceae bacterium]